MISVALILLITSYLCAVDGDLFNCSSTVEYSPCRCLRNGVLGCGGETNFNLSKVFQQISASQTKELSLVLNNTAITELPANVFGDVRINLLSIANAYSLRKIHPKAFESISSYVAMVLITDTPISDISPDNISIFNGMTQAREIWLSNTSITSLKPNAFSGLSGLNSLTIEKNSKLKTLAGDAFYNLPNLDYLILNNNSIDRFVDYTFNLVNKSRLGVDLEIRIIDDRFVTNESFTSLTFAKIKRSLAVFLISLSNINYLEESVFSNVLSNGNKLNVWYTHLECDCRMYWIYEHRDRYKSLTQFETCTDGKPLFNNTDKFANC